MTKIIIVDDQNSVREFLKINLSAEVDIEVVATADNARSAIAQVEEHQPNIVLMDLEMPGNLDGIDATEIITRRFPDIKVLLFTSRDDRQQLNRALEAGAKGYILKNTNVKDIGNIISLTEKGFFQIGPIFGDWNNSNKSHNYQSDGDDTEYVPSKVGAIAQQNNKHSYDDGVVRPIEINHAISDLTSGIFELQQTIRSQENTIVNLTNQYSQVRQEINHKLRNDRSFFGGRKNIYNSRLTSTPIALRRQHFLFISSFFLGVFTVVILMLVITTLGSVL